MLKKNPDGIRNGSAWNATVVALEIIGSDESNADLLAICIERVEDLGAGFPAIRLLFDGSPALASFEQRLFEVVASDTRTPLNLYQLGRARPDWFEHCVRRLDDNGESQWARYLESESTVPVAEIQ